MKAKKLLAFVLAFCMVLGTLGFSALAEETETEPDKIGYTIYIYNADGSEAMTVDATKSVEETYNIKTALEDAYTFENNGFSFGITSPASYKMVLHAGATQTESVEAGPNVTIEVEEGVTLKLEKCSFNVVNLVNNGAIEVYGETTLNINSLTGNSIDFMDKAVIKDSTVGGEVYVAGDVLFKGDNTFTMLADYGDYYSKETPSMWTVEQGASLTLIKLDRYGLGYGDKVTVYGELAEDAALTARGSLTPEDADIRMYGGLVGMTNSAAPNAQNSFTAKNAYLRFGCEGDKSFGNKPGNYYGNYTYSFDNVVMDANAFKFYEDKGTSVVSFKNSDLLAGGVFMTNDTSSKFSFENTKIVSNAKSNGNDDKNQNAGELNLAKSTLTYSAEFTNVGTVNMDTASKITAPEIDASTGTININASDLANGVETLVIEQTNLSAASLEGKISLVNGEDVTVNYNGGDVTLLKTAPVAKIGEVEYATLAEAAENATRGDVITLIADATIAENTDVTIPDGVTLNGNGFEILASGGDHDTATSYGYIIAGGELTIQGITKVEKFSASYYDHIINIGEGASLEITGKARVSLGYGTVFNITGTISNAKTVNKADVLKSFVLPAGISITGYLDAEFNVKDAYVSIGSTTSKNSSADGEFTLNFENSIAEFTNQLTLSAPTSGKTPTFNINVKDSVMTTATKFCIAAPNTNVVIDNSTVTLGTYLRNSGLLTLKNGSVLTGSMIQFGEDGGNDGTIVVDNSDFAITCTSTGHAMDGNGTGVVTLQNNATANISYILESTINIDGTSSLTTVQILNDNTINIDAADLATETETLVIEQTTSLDTASLEGKISFANNENVTADYADNDVKLLKAAPVVEFEVSTGDFNSVMGNVNVSASSSKGEEVDYTVVPKLGYYIASIKVGNTEFTGFDAYKGGTYKTGEITADTEILVTFAPIEGNNEYSSDIATLPSVFKATNAAPVTFGKLINTEVAEYGIKLTKGGVDVTTASGKEGPHFAADSRNGEGQFAIEFRNLPAGEYEVQTYVKYADGTYSYGYKTTFVQE